MGFLSNILSFEKVNIGGILGKLADNPERALIGAIDPFSSKVWSGVTGSDYKLSLIHISEPTRPRFGSRMPSSA